MAVADQFLRIGNCGNNYLLPSTASVSIEQHFSLTKEDAADSNVTAWRESELGRWPALCLDSELRLSHRTDWRRAVFVNAEPTPIGLIADEIQLLGEQDYQVEPFTPLGMPPTNAGHLFLGAMVTEEGLLLVFNPAGLADYLISLYN